MSDTELLNQIKSPVAKVFRRAKIKRRNAVTALFETSWLDISSDVKTYGKVKSEIDPARLFKFSFANAKLVMANDEGKYNPDDNEASLWNGYLNQQRTLVRIEAGYLKTSLGSSGQWVTSEYPHAAQWDEAQFDTDVDLWDDSTSCVMFTGIINGEIPLSDKNEVVFNIKPLTSIFQDFPAKNLTGWTSTGCTASQFIGMIRDQTDGAGGFLFKPFFNDTSTFWDISPTTNVYAGLNSATAPYVIDSTVWDVVEKLAEAENFVPYVSKEGIFRFVARASNTTTVAFEFHGAGSFNTTYGKTIKSISSYAKKTSKYYSDVQVKYVDSDTATSFVTVESAMTVSPASNPWVLGKKVMSIENFFIPNTATASAIATTLFNEYSAVKNEITFTTTFIPQLDLLDRISITYDPSSVNVNSLWDQNNWAEDVTNASTDLIWDASRGDSIKISGAEFNFLSIEIDLDNFQNTFIARQV